MKGKSFNYKFFVMLLLPFLGTILGVNLLLFSQGQRAVFYIALFIILICIVCFIVLLCLEPIYYIVNENDIKVVCGFKHYSFLWKQINHIEIHYDVFFTFLFIKDYILVFNIQSRMPKRYERILKCTKTEKLIETYGGSKLRR